MGECVIDEGKVWMKNYSKREVREKLSNEEVGMYLVNSLGEVADVCIYV